MEFNSKQLREQMEDVESLPMLLLEAIDYLRLFDQEQSSASQLQERRAEITLDYRRSHTYWQTEEELVYGAKVAWRNSSRCIGRIFWESLIVRDLRHLTSAADIFDAIVPTQFNGQPILEPCGVRLVVRISRS